MIVRRGREEEAEDGRRAMRREEGDPDQEE